MTDRLLSVLLCAGMFCSASADRGPLRMVAHRGDYPDCPEGSHLAFVRAVERKADILKLDLHDTRDHVIVISHDDTLGRTMGWKALIENENYEDILKHSFLPVGGFGSEKIVRLDEALAYASKIPETWLDFKYFTPGFAERVLDEVGRAGIASSRLAVATYNRSALEYMQAHHPSIRRIGHVHFMFEFDRGTTLWSTGDRSYGYDVMRALAQLKAYRDRYGLWGINIIHEPETTREFVAVLKECFDWVSIAVIKDEKSARMHAPSMPDGVVTSDIRMARPIFEAARSGAAVEIPPALRRVDEDGIADGR